MKNILELLFNMRFQSSQIIIDLKEIFRQEITWLEIDQIVTYLNLTQDKINQKSAWRSSGAILLSWTDLDQVNKSSIFSLPFWSAVAKIYPFGALFWVHKDENIAQHIFKAHRTIYFSQLLKTNLLSETTVSHGQPAFICLNSAILIVE